jgi:hypothetical protein
LRDVLYAKANKNNQPEDWDNYRQARVNFQKMKKSELIIYFEKKKDLGILKILRNFGSFTKVL